MNVTIKPTHRLRGHIVAPASKAQTHRALFTALLTNGTTKILNPLVCDDTNATANAISALGAKISTSDSQQSVVGVGKPHAPGLVLNCGESGVTMRFVIPLLSLTGVQSEVRGEKSLMRRPIEPLADALKQLNIAVTNQDGSLIVSGAPPEGGEITIRGDVSSQFISGLLLAGTMMKNGLKLKITSQLESRNYVLMTIESLKMHGVHVQIFDNMARLEVPPGQTFQPAVHKILGDFSSASYFLAAAAITKSQLEIHNLNRSLEPDSAFLDILTKMGAKVRVMKDQVNVESGKLTAANINLKDCPDLGPIVAVLGCFADGKTEIAGAARLRYKESDRLASMRTELHTLGAEITETSDGLLVKGPARLKGGVVKSHNDHRVVMALSIAALGAQKKVVIEGAECVSKSYPSFFEDLRSIGIEAETSG